MGIKRVETFQAQGLLYTPCSKTDDARTDGWSYIRSLLAAQQGLRIFAGCCPVLCRQLSQAVTRKSPPDDVDDDADLPPSHMDALNALRYALWTRQLAPPEKAAPITPLQAHYNKLMGLTGFSATRGAGQI